MSRISRYQESISRFIKTKSCYSDIIKNDSDVESIIDLNYHEISIILLTIMNGQYKKRKMRSHHGYYMAAGIDLMLTVVLINDNMPYFKKQYNDVSISSILDQSSVYITECLSQNIETLENSLEKEKILKIQRKIHSFLHKKLLDISKKEKLEGTVRMHRTDIIKHRFVDKNIINDKYRKLKVINKDKLIEYVERKYGSVCQCAFVIGWLLGLGDEKMINNLERIGTHLGILLKISNDFVNLERDITSAKDITYNLLANYGIHECFKLFDESKIKLLEGCFSMDIYNITIKEIIDNIEKRFDEKLKNTDLELASKYSSFSSAP